ncbi:MAG: GNAT family N-acetyltransferase [Gammaproteobacteria bacterium]|nr:GNAT family N-acetyltransferase [Gammaproteobacteria bacterium]
MIQGQNVQLVHASLEQAPDRHAWFQDSESCRLYLGHALPAVTYKSVESDILAAMNSSPAVGLVELAVIAKGQYIGFAYLRRLDLLNRSAEYGVFLGPQNIRGQGLGSETTRLMLDYAFHELNLHRVWLTVFAFNRRAVRCYTQCGFKEEGVLRESVFSGGRYHDTLIMSILSEVFTG